MSSPPRLDSDTLATKLQPLFTRPDIELTVLFGSRARGVERQTSDLDLALMATGVLDTVRETNSLIRMLGFSQIDLVDLRRVPPTLGMVVASRGKLLYESRPGVFAQFCSLAVRRYADAAKIRLAQQTAVNNYLESRGL